MTIGFHVQLHELHAIFGVAQVTIHTLVNDDSGQAQEEIFRIYKIWKRSQETVTKRQEADFLFFVNLYKQYLKDYPGYL